MDLSTQLCLCTMLVIVIVDVNGLVCVWIVLSLFSIIAGSLESANSIVEGISQCLGNWAYWTTSYDVIWCHNHSHKLFFPKVFLLFFMVFYKYIKVYYFTNELSQFLVLSAISIFNDLTLVLISETHPHPLHPLIPTTPRPPHPTQTPPGRVLCTVLITIPT